MKSFGCTCTSKQTTPCETAFSARACRRTVCGIQDTAVAVSVFVLLCLCVAADLIAVVAVNVGLLVSVLLILIIVRISRGRKGFTERKKCCLVP